MLAFSQSQTYANNNKILPIKPGSVYKLKSNWDLEGETYLIPKGVTLIPNGGVFKNGTLVGTNTRVDTCRSLFNHVAIKGTWIVPRISTRMFTDLDYINSLVDVLALANPDVKNKIIIENGDYRVATIAYNGALVVGSNTDLVINGNIHLVPNECIHCSVLLIKNATDVTVSGKGCIYGDKKTHLGTEGEWGMGINVYDSDNVVIRNFSVRDCWGDCIYIGQNSGKVSVLNCRLDNGRRQGISITSATDVMIKGCVISNVSGTDPEYAIDVEPNKGETVKRVCIVDCQSINCKGGFICSDYAENSCVGNVTIDNCIAEGDITKYPYLIWGTDSVSILNCKGVNKPFYLVNVPEAYLRGNTIDGKKGNRIYKFSNSGKRRIIR